MRLNILAQNGKNIYPLKKNIRAAFRPKKGLLWLRQEKQLKHFFLPLRRSDFDKNPFLPVKSKKGKPREKGQIQNKRTRYEIVKKKKKPPA
jgi:hypothetical protein